MRGKQQKRRHRISPTKSISKPRNSLRLGRIPKRRSMASNYDLRSALAEALPAAGPSRATLRAMHDIGSKADPKNNDMKELFVGLDIAPAAAASATAVGGAGGEAAAAAAAGPSAAQVLLDYRREKKAK